MKVMSLTSLTTIGRGQAPQVDVIPDSAILREGKPFFIPSWDSRWEYQPVLAYKISRLGKNIARRFALRYVDAVTVALRVYPCDTIADTVAAGLPAGAAIAFDGSVILGSWLPLPAGDTLISGNDGETTIVNPLDSLAGSIEVLSRYLTFKMGDIVIPPAVAGRSALVIDTGMEYSIDGRTALTCNIK
ncbi:MAG: hypothetical protein NC117_01700 [Pseudoflavonifractor sp.]|nr:hypothetical protein [Pseudoflavonifractor sp.]